MIAPTQTALGWQMPIDDWLPLNRTWIFDRPQLMSAVAPFPPAALMTNTSGLTERSDFATHGTGIYRALWEASDRSLSAYSSIIDFGCGCGRLARMFAGHKGKIQGCDIDARHVEWFNSSLSFMRAKLSRVVRPIRKAVDEPFEYGISFTPESYIRTHWSRWFDVLDYRVGGIHDFQDIVVLQPRKP